MRILLQTSSFHLTCCTLSTSRSSEPGMIITHRTNLRSCIVQALGCLPNLNVPFGIFRVNITLMDMQTVNFYIVLVELMAEMVGTVVERHSATLKARGNVISMSQQDIVQSKGFHGCTVNVMREFCGFSQREHSASTKMIRNIFEDIMLFYAPCQID